MTHYKIIPISVSSKEAFKEASREELRALIVLIECEGRPKSIEEFAERAGISKARASASLVLWEEAGVIAPVSDVPTITEEFERRLEAGEIEEITAKDAARSIRSAGLADMISECARMLGRATLNTTEIKKLTALSEQYSLSPEYILTLASHMAKKGTLNLSRLVDKAIKFSNDGIYDVSPLEAHLADIENESEIEKNYRILFGIYHRALSKTEKESFRKWSRDYGYFTDIVGEAYDIVVSRYKTNYVQRTDELLTHWYESGCKTLSQCRAKHDADMAEKKAKAEKERQAKKPYAKPQKERYGDFDVEDAFLKALNRSYGKKD